ncbi:adenylate/guanylate cyclase domain-containing protein [Saccharicrinis aurantiacus]|uniref:adenylate/guanylate cyclase domain-containing protein n=1 Tax=Saccharicrinis aurantiacus TaxID=1849719 RepID=UPI0024929754|nr:adenylate/guanylate cyclase domain-containing protein [Saccharicrinis aurantiacus]
MKDNLELYLDRLSSLAKRSSTLSVDKKKVTERYYFIQKQDDKYLNLVADHNFNIDKKKSSKLSNLKRFNRVSLLYVSIDGFKRLTNHPLAENLIDKLDELKLLFDEIAKKYSIVKIKTIGDSFVFGGGMLEENRTNPIDVILAAFEMQQAAIDVNGGENGSSFWDVSIGIHTGPVLAEPTNRRSSPFRLAGSSVDLTCRLGMACNPGEIHISSMTYELIKEFFECKYSGKMPVKYKGAIEMYTVVGLLPQLQDAKKTNELNRKFLTKYSLIQFIDIQEHILDMLEQELPNNLYYHNVKHTIDVVTGVELIGWAEGLNEEEILILKFAAIFHDTGHTLGYDQHEYHGTIIARKFLAKYHYPEDIIEKICELIMATEYPPEPKNKLEEVICDSDLDYLGRSDFIPVSEKLYDELKVRDMIGSYNDWIKRQLSFIKGHQYFTETARNLRQVNKYNQIERLEKLLTNNIS